MHAAARRADAIERAAGDRVAAHALDVSDRDAVDALARELERRSTRSWSPPARTSRSAACTSSRPRTGTACSRANLTGAFNLVRALLPALRAARGDVVLIGSVSGGWPDRSGAAYQASKAGLLALARGRRLRGSGEGVRFTTIAPGRRRHADPRQPPGAADAETRAQMLHARGRRRGVPVRGLAAAARYVPELTILPTALQALGRSAC